MYSSLSSVRHARQSSSLTALLTRHHGEFIASRSFSALPGKYGPQESSQDGSKFLAKIPRRKISDHVGGLYGSSGLSSSLVQFNGNVTTPYALSFLSSMHSDACKDFLSGRGSPMNFVRDIIEAEDRNSMEQP